jgi:hypothetical protein
MQLLTITGFDQVYRQRFNAGYGKHIMAAILQFQKRSTIEKTLLEPGHSATILMYTGVRIERIDFEALRDKVRSGLHESVRIAN